MDMARSSSSVSTRSLPARVGSQIVSKSKAYVLDWPIWWKEQSLFAKVAPIGFFIPYWIILYAIGGLRSDHVAVGLLLLALSYGGRWTCIIRNFLLPLFMTGIIYDSQRFYSDFIRGPIHVREPYLFDKTFFGIATPQGTLTPNEWWQLHTRWYLDLVTGFAYLVFIAVFVTTSACFRFYFSRKGTPKLPGAEILRRAPAMMWGFFWVNMIGYSTYYWFAAAPPWYVAQYGLGPADLSVKASQAGCVRFDQLLGTHFFTDFYGKSADVFGAVPSLHVAYPLIAAYFAFRFGALRIPTVLFYLLMCFSAVYLNHHYVLDILWGSAYAILVAVVLDRWFQRASFKDSAVS